MRPAIVAVVGGVGIVLVLLVPFVAVQVRRHGSLTLGRALISAAVPVYALALGTYTLLPLPSDLAALCAAGGAGVQSRPGQFVLDIIREQSTSSGVLQNPAVQQFALNVALFVPLGILVRLLLRRGVLVASLLGLGISVLIEVTQVTGVWGLFPCAYRLLDADDLIANTTGAVIGALLGPLLAFLRKGNGLIPSAPRPLTRRRRLLGMLCDVLLAFWATLVVAAICNGIVLVVTGSTPTDTRAADLIIGFGVALAFLAALLKTGRTPGEAVVRLRPRIEPSGTSVLVRWLLGIGGYLLLQISHAGQFPGRDTRCGRRCRRARHRRPPGARLSRAGMANPGRPGSAHDIARTHETIQTGLTVSCHSNCRTATYFVADNARDSAEVATRPGNGGRDVVSPNLSKSEVLVNPVLILDVGQCGANGLRFLPSSVSSRTRCGSHGPETCMRWLPLN